MSFSNDFTPFATGVGANVLAPATWAADPAKTAGFSAGIAPSVKLNTAWRQSTFVSAMIAQFTADFGPGNVVDNGNLPAFETQFEAALIKYASQFFLLNIPSGSFFVNFGTGNDTWDGTSATFVSGTTGPKKTTQAMITAIASNFTTTGTVSIQVVGNAGPLTIPQSLIGAWSITASGASTISAPSSGVNGGRGININQGVVATITGFTFSTLNANVGVSSGQAIISGCNFTGATGESSILVSSGQANVIGASTYTGNGAGIFICNSPGKIALGISGGAALALTVSGTPAFSGACATVVDGGLIFVNPGSSITGSATGKRFSANVNGMIDTNSTGLIFPGSVAGTQANGGVVV